MEQPSVEGGRRGRGGEGREEQIEGVKGGREEREKNKVERGGERRVKKGTNMLHKCSLVDPMATVTPHNREPIVLGVSHNLVAYITISLSWSH